jgi:hypothetical protein
MPTILPNFTLRPGNPDFLDLPWEYPLQDWKGRTPRLEEVTRGLSRHTVLFVNYDGRLFALKELPKDLAKREYESLREIEDRELPAVTSVGYAQFGPPQSHSILFTRYLDRSIPYRSIFIQANLNRYRQHLLDAIASLLVQLHLAGVFWGDCSLSNTLFRRDAGALQAYLVDAETAEIHSPHLSPVLRMTDLQIMGEEVDGDLNDLVKSGYITANFPVPDTSEYIRQRYNSLWEEITRELIISPDERYRIHERVQALNALGFSVGSMEIQPAQEGDKLRLRALVTDRNFHRNLLFSLTGIEAEEMQARQIMNEIVELKATFSRDRNRSIPLSVTAYHWMEYTYKPVLARLEPLHEHNETVGGGLSPAELYCQVLEHKWYLSERAQHDVGHQAAVDDYLQTFKGSSSSGNSA